MMSSPAPFLCPTCLHLSSTPVSLPCGHAFCLACLQTIDEGLDRHCCPQCRQEYHPNYYNNSYYYYFKEYCEDPGMSQFPLKYTPTVGKNAQGAGEEIAIRESHRFQNKTPLNDRENCSISSRGQPGTSQMTDKLNNTEEIDETVQNMPALKIKNHDVQEEVEGKGVNGFQNKTPLLPVLNPVQMKMQEQSMDVKGISRFQNKTPLLEQDCQKGAEILAGNEINESSGITISSDNVKFSLRDLKAAKEKESYVLSGHGASESISFKTNQHNIMRADIGEMKEKCLERKGSGEFQNNSPSAKDSELYNYLKSKIIASNVTEVGLENDVLQNKTPHVSVLNMQKQNSSLRNNREMTVHQSIGMEEPESPRIDQNLIAFNDEGDLESKENLAFQNKSLILAEKMAELKLKLMSKASDLTNKLENAEMVLKKEQECKRAVTMAHAKLRENALKLVGELTSFAQNYSKTIMELIEQELSPGEEMLHNKVEKASEVCKKIKKTMHEVDNLLKEKDANVFTSKIQGLESEIEGCKETKQPEENQELKFDLTKVCPELEQLSCEFRDKLGQVQRSLRSEFNPSEVTFDPETLHPNLILSEDLKMVTFSAKKQQYDPTPKRFTNFIQALSAQSFSAGVHRWEVQLDCAPWLLGICVASSLPRSGLPSALEMSPSSWGLMWNQSLLSAFHQSRTTQLQKTPLVSRRVELKLDCDRGQLDFYYLSETSGRHHIHMFKIDTREPLHLAYRMLSGDPKGRATICS